MEELLGNFLLGTQNVELLTRLTEVLELPKACRTAMQRAKAFERTWTAWTTLSGPVAAWGDYDGEGSKRIKAHLLRVEWWNKAQGHHALWTYSYPTHPHEWVIGRGRQNERR